MRHPGFRTTPRRLHDPSHPSSVLQQAPHPTTARQAPGRASLPSPPCLPTTLSPSTRLPNPIAPTLGSRSAPRGRPAPALRRPPPRCSAAPRPARAASQMRRHASSATWHGAPALVRWKERGELPVSVESAHEYGKCP
eukprot:179745-Chlamydomonas_euryale.AAC.2